jgi:hypothetical protein
MAFKRFQEKNACTQLSSLLQPEKILSLEVSQLLLHVILKVTVEFLEKLSSKFSIVLNQTLLEKKLIGPLLSNISQREAVP